MSETFARSAGTLLSVLDARRRLTASRERSAAIVITRPPEIFTCVRISIPDDADVFMIFDSHPRPDHPDGAGFIFSTSIDATAGYLDNLLAIDESILADHSLQWQTQLLANFSGLLFVARTTRFDSNPVEAERAMIESSLSILALQAEVSDLKFQNAELQKDLKAVECKAEEERWHPSKLLSLPKSSKKSPEPGWIPASTRKKHRKRKSDNGSSSPTDYRPSMSNASSAIYTYRPVSRRSDSTRLLQWRTTAGYRMAPTTIIQTRRVS